MVDEVILNPIMVKEDHVPYVSIVFTPEICKIYNTVGEILKKFSVFPILSSGGEGKHGKNSKHYRNQALDISFKNWPKFKETRLWITDEVRKTLGVKFDVVLEKTHLHVEYDPK